MGWKRSSAERSGGGGWLDVAGEERCRSLRRDFRGWFWNQRKDRCCILGVWNLQISPKISCICNILEENCRPYLRLDIWLLFRRPSVVSLPFTITISLAVSVPLSVPVPFQVAFAVTIPVSVSTAMMRGGFHWSLYHYLVLLVVTGNLAHRKQKACEITRRHWNIMSACPNKSAQKITCMWPEIWKRTRTHHSAQRLTAQWKQKILQKESKLLCHYFYDNGNKQFVKSWGYYCIIYKNFHFKMYELKSILCYTAVKIVVIGI